MDDSANLHISKSAHPRIFLIGMMGAGKTFWAEKLKKKFKITSYDLDSLVEMMEEKTIAEMFAEDGEEYFRKAEAKMLHMFKEKKQFILSCGGGTPCFNDNMLWMNENGITVWIDEPLDVLVSRLITEKDHRPLIKDLSDGELEKFLAEKLKERNPYYSQATHRLTGKDLNEKSFFKIIQHA
jgi:shikimate kinase